MKLLTVSSERLTGLGLAILRISLGIIMFAHGAQKVLGAFGGHGLDATVMGMSGGLGIPAFLVYCNAFSEFLGGVLLIIGLGGRIASGLSFINMMVAVLLVHLTNGFFGPAGLEYPGVLAMMALSLTIAGPGSLSLDHKLFKKS